MAACSLASAVELFVATRRKSTARCKSTACEMQWPVKRLGPTPVKPSRNAPQVVDFDPIQVRHTVQYDDGDTEILRLWGDNQQVGASGTVCCCPERGGERKGVFLGLVWVACTHGLGGVHPWFGCVDGGDRPPCPSLSLSFSLTPPC